MKRNARMDNRHKNRHQTSDRPFCIPWGIEETNTRSIQEASNTSAAKWNRWKAIRWILFVEKNKSPTGGLEPPTTRLRAWRSTD